MTVEERIRLVIDGSPVVLFMKGDRLFPQCGFSGKAIQILEACGTEFDTVNVLMDEELRQGIKQFSSWPTVPQLYVRGEFVGGSDIMMQLYESGELQQMLS